jgi:hypothetical protein
MPNTVIEPNRMPPVNLKNSERDQIRQRVANFKAHQERFAREREDFAASQLKRMLGFETRSATTLSQTPDEGGGLCPTNQIILPM